MALQYAVEIRNAQLDVLESIIGTSAVLKLRTGAAPSSCASSDSGTVLASMSLPSNWMAAASNGQKEKAGTWQTTNAAASGTAEHFRLYASDGSTCYAQGSVSLVDGGGDLQLDNVSITSGQTVTIEAFTLVAANS